MAKTKAFQLALFKKEPAQKGASASKRGYLKSLLSGFETQSLLSKGERRRLERLHSRKRRSRAYPKKGVY
jgi:hypothetical protein